MRYKILLFYSTFALLIPCIMLLVEMIQRRGDIFSYVLLTFVVVGYTCVAAIIWDAQVIDKVAPLEDEIKKLQREIDILESKIENTLK